MRRLRIGMPKAIMALAMIVALQCATTAHADIDLVITVDGTTQTFTAPPATDQTLGATINGVNIIASAHSDSPGSPSGAFILGSTLSLEDVDGGTHAVTIVVSATNYMSPTAPPNLGDTSSLGGTSTFAGASGLTLQSYVNQDNGLNSTTGFSPGLQSSYESGNIGSGGGASFDLNPGSTTISTLSAPYSMTSVVNLTVTGGATVNFTSTEVLSGITPEPSTMALAALGSLGLISYGLRRRKALGA